MIKHAGRPLLAAALTTTLGVLAAAPALAQTTIQIGVSSPLSGAQTAAGQDNLGGVKLAVQELNAKPITVNGKPVRFEVLAEDDQADPRQGVSVAQKLVDGGVKFVVGPYNSGVTLPASRIYNEGGVVVATVASNPKVTEQGFERLFRVGASDSQLGAKMALYAARELKLKRVAIIDDRTAYGVGVADEFAREAKANGLTITSREYTSDKAADFTATLTTIKAAKPDAIFFGGYSPQAGPMVRQMKSLGVQAKLLGGDGICSSETAKLAGGDLVGDNVWCTQGGAMLNRLNAGQAFVTKYRNAHKRDPLTYAVSFYDATHLIADAMQRANSTDPQKVAAAMAAGNYNGVAGSYVFDSKRDLKSSPVTVFTFKGGQPSPVAGL
ncbi:branched-chain amino acid ABC transporter substrate-binding protein [Aquabacterium sp. A7-Y]|uniref:branched-chain amino acid ABC transporter substrate-binding protein n=1 Tax=Aquabacterium sp. A7-Y TaxID=1349605 RepID=UPI00223CA24E|nr:branched-chain amino acid ABC transporter substrate-binding protein [Aquabacterium sp. A7-Y]MCW7540577.1 branched-chain amino acid ABC transporter substrate-binding protein [Aquabacterium sp. A7-Y]